MTPNRAGVHFACSLGGNVKSRLCPSSWNGRPRPLADTNQTTFRKGQSLQRCQRLFMEVFRPFPSDESFLKAEEERRNVPCAPLRVFSLNLNPRPPDGATRIWIERGKHADRLWREVSGESRRRSEGPFFHVQDAPETRSEGYGTARCSILMVTLAHLMRIVRVIAPGCLLSGM